MNFFRKVQEAANSAATTVDAGVRKLSYRSEIHDRRKLIRNLKAEWGCFIFDHMENKDKDEKVKASYEVLTKQIAEKQIEIHQWEEKFLVLSAFVTDSLPVKRRKITNKKSKKSTSVDRKFNCSKCSGAITTDLVECSSFQFHPPCFSCYECGKEISTAHAFLFEGNKPNCESCGEKHLQTFFERANKHELLTWSQKITEGFNQVEIHDFDPRAWKYGLGFAALCAYYRPDLIKWKSITERTEDLSLTRCQAGLDALNKAGCPMLLVEAEELHESDEKSIMMQVLLIKKFFKGDQPHEDGLKEWNMHLAHIDRPLHKFEPEMDKTSFGEKFEERGRYLQKTEGPLSQGERECLPMVNKDM